MPHEDTEESSKDPPDEIETLNVTRVSPTVKESFLVHPEVEIRPMAMQQKNVDKCDNVEPEEACPACTCVTTAPEVNLPEYLDLEWTSRMTIVKEVSQAPERRCRVLKKVKNTSFVSANCPDTAEERSRLAMASTQHTVSWQ
ncbi:MAG: hypothetical protein AAGD07_26185 [Planctomycetota bacterium]